MKLRPGILSGARRLAWQAGNAVLRRELQPGQARSPREPGQPNNAAFSCSVVWVLWHQAGESSASHNGENNRNCPKSAE